MAVEDKHKNRFSIKVLGEEIVVVGNISHEYINKLVSFINEVGQEINSAYPCLPRQRLLGLAIINLADEYFKLKEKHLEDKKNTDLLEGEINQLQDKLRNLRKEYEELLSLLEEVD